MKIQVIVYAFIISIFNINISFAKSSNKLELSDLGIGPTNMQQDLDLSDEQLNQRSEYLQEHQFWGLVTLGLMAATFLFAEQAEIEDEENYNKPLVHQYLGMATAFTYWTAFYYQYNAPKPKELKDQSWNMKLHKSLAWVHAPLMVLTPIAGILATQAAQEGKSLSGIAKYKDTLGGLTMATFTLAATLMVIEF